MFESGRRCLALQKSHFYNINVHLQILIIVALIKDGSSTIPESSQEGALQPFNSYQDVIMFHYTVPKQVLRATWQFSAFMDSSKCPQREVHIFLKWGSYPVMPINNTTTSPNVRVNHNDTVHVSTVTAFEPNTMTILPINSPQPGDWFVGAYLTHWDKKVLQKGLGSDCRYSLGSVSVWSEINDINNIPLNHPIKIKTSETISYYKIYIPMGTLDFRVDIWGCSSNLKRSFPSDICIKDMVLKERTLPIYNHSDPRALKLSSMDTHAFTEISPYQDDYYYLMVVSDKSISLNIKITVHECPIVRMGAIAAQKGVNVPFYSKDLDQFDSKILAPLLQKHEINDTKTRGISDSGFDGSIVVDNSLTVCVPRYRLVRIKYPPIFLGEYLLQGTEWLTSWLSLSDSGPVITQFEIMPLIDIGGVLDITIGIEMNKFLTEKQVQVLICISRGKVPRQEAELTICKSEQIMMQLSSSGRQNASIVIPYPEPGAWFISFQSVCKWNNKPVHCEMESILMSLNIKLRGCIFEGNDSCGQFGTCQEIHKGPLHYAACKCFGGYQGLDCSDASNAIPNWFIITRTLMLVLSNLLFLPAIYITLKRKLYTETLVYTSTMIFSALYHACDQQYNMYCIAKFEVLQYCDFFLGILAFWVTSIIMADVQMQHKSLYHMAGVIIIFFHVESDKTGLKNILIPLVIGAFIPVSSYASKLYKMNEMKWPTKVTDLITGLLLVGFGIFLFSFIETESNYYYVHSTWHIIISLSLVFLLPPEKEELAPQMNAFNLPDYKGSSENSVLSVINI
ncbi:hypothetical protein QAD02_014552 [Eretmocerus hayati]|uniref:Uncharacterized protein n=1 Tax=Eretmocerus hayati TaxID=131215 RepID=A0ACC2PAJ4_9HYME|nr:hypothetical protein QAD02_014552 [Eretmocerus hayati]